VPSSSLWPPVPYGHPPPWAPTVTVCVPRAYAHRSWLERSGRSTGNPPRAPVLSAQLPVLTDDLLVTTPLRSNRLSEPLCADGARLLNVRRVDHSVVRFLRRRHRGSSEKQPWPHSSLETLKLCSYSRSCLKFGFWCVTRNTSLLRPHSLFYRFTRLESAAQVCQHLLVSARDIAQNTQHKITTQCQSTLEVRSK